MKERIVIKVGTSTLTNESGKINITNMSKIVEVLSELTKTGIEVILVTSAAVTVGYEKMNLSSRPTQLSFIQAAAAVGQCELMHMYDQLFHYHDKIVAQILLDEQDMRESCRRNNLLRTFKTLLSQKIIPIVNENDSVSFQEIESPDKLFGDNDTLSAHVANLCQATKLIILSDIEGLYDCDPHKNKKAKLIKEVPVIDENIFQLAGGAGTTRGTGGMTTKLQAAELVTRSGCDMYILNGTTPESIFSILKSVRYLKQERKHYK